MQYTMQFVNSLLVHQLPVLGCTQRTSSKHKWLIMPSLLDNVAGSNTACVNNTARAESWQ
jgi:hypothetical protein